MRPENLAFALVKGIVSKNGLSHNNMVKMTTIVNNQSF